MTYGRIEVQVAGHAREFFPGGRDRHWVDLAGPATAREIIEQLGVSPDLVMAVFVDGELRDKDAVPPPGAILLLISPPSGG